MNKPTLKAKLIEKQENGRNHGGEKEMIKAWSVVALIKGELVEVLTCRAYMGRSKSASTVYASLWMHGGGVYTAGQGSAGGYGYDKISAAIASAISSAGIELYGSPYRSSHEEQTPAEYRAMMRKRAHIGGTGCHEEAFKAIARDVCKARGKMIVIHH